MNGAVWATIWQSAVGTLVTALLGVAMAWLAHRKGWLAKPAAAVAGWLRTEGGTISTDVVKLIVDELERRGIVAHASGQPGATDSPPSSEVAKPEQAPAGPPPWHPPDYDPKTGDPETRS